MWFVLASALAAEPAPAPCPVFGSDGMEVKELQAACLGQDAVYAVTRSKKDLVVKRVSGFLRAANEAGATDAGPLLDAKALEEGKAYLVWDPSDADTTPTVRMVAVAKEWSALE